METNVRQAPTPTNDIEDTITDFRTLLMLQSVELIASATGYKQEGTAATNQEIAKTVRILGNEFAQRKIDTEILVSESFDYNCLFRVHPYVDRCLHRVPRRHVLLDLVREAEAAHALQSLRRRLPGLRRVVLLVSVRDLPKLP